MLLRATEVVLKAIRYQCFPIYIPLTKVLQCCTLRVLAYRYDLDIYWLCKEASNSIGLTASILSKISTVRGQKTRLGSRVDILSPVTSYT